MTKYINLLCAFVVPLFAVAQTPLTEGAKQLFSNTPTRISAAEKNEIYRQTGFLLAPDKKQFLQDQESADYPFDAFVYTTDLNKDGKEEVLVQFGNTYTSGQTGSSIMLFIKNNAGGYQMHLGFPGLAPDVLTTSNSGYPDLVIGGPGFEYPVWRWNGKEYRFYKNIKETDLEKLKRTPLEEMSKTYAKTLQ